MRWRPHGYHPDFRDGYLLRTFVQGAESLKIPDERKRRDWSAVRGDTLVVVNSRRSSRQN